MSRVIKFRVWDGKTYHENIELGSGDDGCFSWGYIDDEKNVIEQFTGLQDKNGRDIHEGDIIKWNHPFSDIGVVEWALGDAFNTYPACAFWALNVKARGICAFQMDDIYEVIGNIYENPELLTKMKEANK